MDICGDSGGDCLSSADYVGGKYRTARLIAQGGMAQIFQVFHVTLGQRRAMKIMLPEFAGQAEYQERLRREARGLRHVNHPNIVRVFDYGVAQDGREYYVMELVDGQTLRQRLRQREPLAVHDCLEIAARLLAGLHAVHQIGLVHRDVKPENILLCEETGLKLLDFGIAKHVGGASAEVSLTQEGVALGTPRYMAPEQLIAAPVDMRTDLYSVGYVLWEMLSRRAPFANCTTREVLLTKHRCLPVPLRQVLGDRIPVALDTIVQKACAPHPDDRFASTKAFFDALVACAYQLAEVGWCDQWGVPVERIADIPFDTESTSNKAQKPYRERLGPARSERTSEQTPLPGEGVEHRAQGASADHPQQESEQDAVSDPAAKALETGSDSDSHEPVQATLVTMSHESITLPVVRPKMPLLGVANPLDGCRPIGSTRASADLVPTPNDRGFDAVDSSALHDAASAPTKAARKRAPCEVRPSSSRGKHRVFLGTKEPSAATALIGDVLNTKADGSKRLRVDRGTMKMTSTEALEDVDAEADGDGDTTIVRPLLLGKAKSNGALLDNGNADTEADADGDGDATIVRPRPLGRPLQVVREPYARQRNRGGTRQIASDALSHSSQGVASPQHHAGASSYAARKAALVSSGAGPSPQGPALQGVSAQPKARVSGHVDVRRTTDDHGSMADTVRLDASTSAVVRQQARGTNASGLKRPYSYLAIAIVGVVLGVLVVLLVMSLC